MRCWIIPYSGIPDDFSASLWQLLQNTSFVASDWHCVYSPLFWRSAWHFDILHSPLNGSAIDAFFTFSFLSFGLRFTDISPRSLIASSALNPYFSAHILITSFDNSIPIFSIPFIITSDIIIMFNILFPVFVPFFFYYTFFSIFFYTFEKVEPNIAYKVFKL